MSVEQGNDVDLQVREAVRVFHQAFQDRALGGEPETTQVRPKSL